MEDFKTCISVDKDFVVRTESVSQAAHPVHGLPEPVGPRSNFTGVWCSSPSDKVKNEWKSTKPISVYLCGVHTDKYSLLYFLRYITSSENFQAGFLK